MQRTSCPYLHRCLKCNNMHPAIHCFSSQPTFNQNPSNVQPPFQASTQPRNTIQPPFSPPLQDNSNISQGLWDLGVSPIQTNSISSHLSRYPDRSSALALGEGLKKGLNLCIQGHGFRLIPKSWHMHINIHIFCRIWLFTDSAGSEGLGCGCYFHGGIDLFTMARTLDEHSNFAGYHFPWTSANYFILLHMGQDAE